MRSGKVLTLMIVFFICGNFFISHAQLIRHSYRFNGTFSASEPDCGPDVIQVKAGGNCGAGTNPGVFVSDTLPYCANRRTVYHTNLHWGLMYPNTNGLISTTYTIHMYVKNTSWGNGIWARIIDFSSTADNDVGMYYERTVFSDRCLRFWPTGIVGRCPFFSLNTYYLLSFTRNGSTGIIDVYVNGTLFTSYNDRLNNYVALPGNPVYIYRDDGGIYPCESGEANIAYLSFSNQYSLQPEISSVYNNICRIANINTADFSFSPVTSCGTGQNTTVSYTGNIASTGTDYTFNWDWDGGTVVSGSGMGPFVVNWNTTGVKNVKLTITGGACTAPVTGNRLITVGSLNASAIALPAACTGNSNGSVTVSPSGGVQPYQYSMDGINYQSLPTFAAPAGQYSVVVKDANNCTVNTNVLVPINNDITVQSLSDTSLCPGGSVKLFTTGNATSYLWQPASGLDNANAKEPVATPTVSTEYIVTATTGSCTKRDTVKLTVTPPVTVSAISQPANCTSNNNGTITLSAGGGAPPYQFALNGSAFQRGNVFTVPPGQYAATVKDANNCTGTTSVAVSSVNNISVQTLGDTSVCQGQSVKLLTTSNATSYLWQPASGLNNADSKDPVASPVATTEYIVTATSGNCTQKDTVIIVVQRFSVTATPDTTVIPGMPFKLMAYAPQVNNLQGLSYLWSPSAGVNDPNIANPTAIVQSDQIFQVEVKSPQGCKATATVSIKVLKEPDIYVPNAFTPNNDGRNDLLKPVGVGMQSLKYFRVFNRWGKLMYVSALFNQGWNGKTGGADQPAGTYVWMVEGVTLSGKVVYKKGAVVLIR